MAIFGSLSGVCGQLAHNPRFKAALVYLAEMQDARSAARQRLQGIAEGVTEKIPLADGTFALEQVYPPKARSDGFFESHRKYIDVQVVVAGEELMEVEEVARLSATALYNPERDLLKYADTATASVLRVRAGGAAVFFPEDGHMPSLQWRGPGLVRKTVVKVPVG